MSRKWKDVEITSPENSRDLGKTFRIREMSATQGERWGMRALGCAAKAGVRIPDEMLTAGMAGFAALLGTVGSFLAGPRDEVEALLKEMFDCVLIIMPAAPEGRVLIDEDIEEIATRMTLRDEVLELHVGFSIRAKSLEALALYLEWMQGQMSSSNTPTSSPQSDGSSPADMQPWSS